MASVPSLDQDMRRLRLDRYTPQAANEVRAWIEQVLSESLAPGDLLDALKDGVALCKLANLVLPSPGIRFKASAMPFTQRENISQFLTACERSPLLLPSHDRFLTVDLYDHKDPAQVLQCLGAFSRAANAANPARFPTVIGPKRAGPPSPTHRPQDSLSASSTPNKGSFSPAHSANGGIRSPPGSVSSWSKREDENATAPAWNIHQYGYMGGASQGNQGISFGSRRQIVAPGVQVPSLTEKDRLRRDQAQEEERARVQAEEEARRAREVEEAREVEAERQRWETETRRAREEERLKVEEQKRAWAEEERRWKVAEEARLAEEQAAEQARVLPQGPTGGLPSKTAAVEQKGGESDRIAELERQLEEAKERERQYQLERAGRTQASGSAASTSTPYTTISMPTTTTPQPPPQPEHRITSFTADTPEALSVSTNAADSTAPPPLPGPRPLPQAQTQTQTQTQPSHPVDDDSAPPLPGPRPTHHSQTQTQTEARTDVDNTPAPPLPGPRPLPATQAFQAQSNAQLQPSSTTPSPSPIPPPTVTIAATPVPLPPRHLTGPRPLPVPKAPFASSPAQPNRFSTHTAQTAAEQGAEDARRAASQQRTRDGGIRAKGLLEREMERERERQREWEAEQMAGRR